MINLYLGDCLDVLRKIPTESVDAIITDPPYGIDYQSCHKVDKTKRFAKIKNDKAPFIWWLYDAYRITKPDGCLVCFCRWDVEGAFLQAIEWAGFCVKSQVIWDRQVHGMGDLKAQFGPRHDIIWFAVKGKYQFPGKRPQSVITSPRVTSLMHPNEKPIDLMDQLVCAVTAPGQTILDPFVGSGSTGVAAVQSGRNFVGIELDPKYYQIAQQRLEEAGQSAEKAHKAK